MSLTVENKISRYVRDDNGHVILSLVPITEYMSELTIKAASGANVSFVMTSGELDMLRYILDKDQTPRKRPIPGSLGGFWGWVSRVLPPNL